MMMPNPIPPSSHPLSSLFYAVMAGDATRTHELLQRNPALADAYSPTGMTPLHLAAHFGHADVAEVLLAFGANIEARTRTRLGNTPLHVAVLTEEIAVARVLLEHGAAVTAHNAHGWDPLHVAALHGNVALTRLLLEHGADPIAANGGGLTPLELARQAGHEAVATLLQQQAETVQAEATTQTRQQPERDVPAPGGSM